MSTQRPLLGARRKEDFQLCRGEDDRTHVAAVRDEPWRLREGALTLEERLSYGGPGGNPGGATAHLLGANLCRHVAPVEADALGAVCVHAELNPHALSQPGVGVYITFHGTGPEPCERNQAIQGTAVQQMPADVPGNRAADGALP